MYPILWKLDLGAGTFELGAYAFFLVLASVVSSSGALWYGKKKFAFPIWPNFLALLLMIGLGLVGARGLNILLNWEFYQENPALIRSFDLRGFSLFGGIFLGGLGGIVFARATKRDSWNFFDMYAPFLGIGIALSRWGCFLNGCCFGRETILPWGVVFPNFSQAHFHQLAEDSSNLFVVAAVHPTQLYELFGALAATLLAFWLNQKKLFSGAAILAFLILFCLVRWLNLAFRVMPESYLAPVWAYPLFYGLVIVFCGVLFWRKARGFTAKSKKIQ